MRFSFQQHELFVLNNFRQSCWPEPAGHVTVQSTLRFDEDSQCIHVNFNGFFEDTISFGKIQVKDSIFYNRLVPANLVPTSMTDIDISASKDEKTDTKKCTKQCDRCCVRKCGRPTTVFVIFQKSFMQNCTAYAIRVLRVHVIQCERNSKIIPYNTE